MEGCFGALRLVAGYDTRVLSDETWVGLRNAAELGKDFSGFVKTVMGNKPSWTVAVVSVDGVFGCMGRQQQTHLSGRNMTKQKTIVAGTN